MGESSHRFLVRNGEEDIRVAHGDDGRHALLILITSSSIDY